MGRAEPSNSSGFLRRSVLPRQKWGRSFLHFRYFPYFPIFFVNPYFFPSRLESSPHSICSTPPVISGAIIPSGRPLLCSLLSPLPLSYFLFLISYLLFLGASLTWIAFCRVFACACLASTVVSSPTSSVRLSSPSSPFFGIPLREPSRCLTSLSRSFTSSPLGTFAAPDPVSLFCCHCPTPRLAGWSPDPPRGILRRRRSEGCPLLTDVVYSAVAGVSEVCSTRSTPEGLSGCADSPARRTLT